MIGEQLSVEAKRDCFLFAKLTADVEIWPALQRLVKRLHDDAITEWEMDKTGDKSKKWLAGSRNMAQQFIRAIEETAKDAQTVAEEEKHAQVVVKSHSEDGVGSGDLAI